MSVPRTVRFWGEAERPLLGESGRSIGPDANVRCRRMRIGTYMSSRSIAGQELC